jgi:hypothetical protein
LTATIKRGLTDHTEATAVAVSIPYCSLLATDEVIPSRAWDAE